MTDPSPPAPEPAPEPAPTDPTRGPDGLDPSVDARATVPPPTPGDDLAVVVAELDRAEAGRLASTVQLAGRAAVGLCATAAATAIVAAALSVWAWGAAGAGLVVAGVLLLAGVGLPAFIAARARRLADALAHPREAIAEARDLVGRAKGSPELGRLAMRLRHRGPARTAARAGRRLGRAGRVRRLVSSGRMVSAVIGLAEPDPDRHRHLLPFTPVRLRSLWLAITASLWVWAASWVVGAVAVLALLVRAVS